MKGIAFSGGGSKGQFHVGVVKCLMGSLKIQYDAFAGVSVGALVASLLAQFPAGQEGLAARTLECIFDGVTNDSVWKRWKPFGALHGVWNPFGKDKASFLNAAPLHTLVRKNLSRSALACSGKILRVGATSLDSGVYEIFREDDDCIVDAVLASSAYPAFLNPVQIAGRGLYTDGGVREVTPVKSLIDAGCDEIHVVICHPDNAPIKFSRTPSAIKVALRSLDIMSDELTWGDLRKAELYNRLVEAGLEGTKRKVSLRVIHPEETLLEDSLEFDKRVAESLQDKGYKAALEAVLR